MRIWFVLVWLAFSYLGLGQSVFEVASAYDLPASKVRKYANRLLNVRDRYDGSKKRRKRVSEICEKRSNYFLEMNEEYQLMAEGELTDFLQEVVDRIVDKNPELRKRKFKVFVRRSSAVNAHSFGEGIILFNMGLLVRLHDVNELAFVIAHEMGHDVSEHNYISIAKRAAFYDSKEYTELKKSRRKKYGNATSQEKIYSKIFASMGLHSRANELVADELGAQYAMNAGFSRKGVLHVLELLKDSDKPIWTDTLDIQQMLSSPDYTIPTRFLSEVDAFAPWSEMESLHDIPDSLRTHPHCEERVKNIQSKTKENHGDVSDLAPAYQALQTQILYEYLHTIFEENNLGKTLYFAMVRKQEGDNSLFLDALIDICLYDMAYGLQTQTFSDKCEFPDALNSNGYNKVLEFAHAQNSKRYLKIANGYYEAHLAQADNFELKKILSLYKKYFDDGFIRQSDIKKAALKNDFYKGLIHQLKQ